MILKGFKFIDFDSKIFQFFSICQLFCDLSLEQKVRNSIKTLLNSNLDQLKEYRNFFKPLLEDLTDYGTLPYYTLRKILNLQPPENEIQKTLNELKNLKDELRENYLSKEIEKFKNIQKEIIIAIENRNTS